MSSISSYHVHVCVSAEKEKDKKSPKINEECSEAQGRRVEVLLSELVKQFPVRAVAGKVSKEN